MKGGIASKRSRQDLEKAITKVIADHQALRDEWRGHPIKEQDDSEQQRIDAAHDGQNLSVDFL